MYQFPLPPVHLPQAISLKTETRGRLLLLNMQSCTLCLLFDFVMTYYMKLLIHHYLQFHYPSSSSLSLFLSLPPFYFSLSLSLSLTFYTIPTLGFIQMHAHTHTHAMIALTLVCFCVPQVVRRSWWSSFLVQPTSLLTQETSRLAWQQIWRWK